MAINFTINVAKVNKPKGNSSKQVSRKCLAVVITDENTIKARIDTSPVEGCNEFLVLPFTTKSLELKGKTIVFFKDKDKYGHNQCYFRTTTDALINPGTNNQFDALRPGLLISGYIKRIDGKLYFDYEDLVAYKEGGVHITDIRINEDKPIFNK